MRILRSATYATRRFLSMLGNMSHNEYPSITHKRKAVKKMEPASNIHWITETKMEGGPSVVYRHPDITYVAEYIKNKLYFTTLVPGRREARSTSNIHFFSIDNELVYNNFYNDFGPLNLACLYKYCCKVNGKLKNPDNKYKHIVHYTSQNQQKRANSAYLIASYAVLYLKKTPKEAYKPLVAANGHPLRLFQDASMGVSNYTIRLLDCLNAIHKAAAFGFFNFEDFDLAEYDKYEQMKNGDLNWMIPQKFLAFVGPSTETGTVYHPPERYIDYFIKNGVVAVVRLNKKSYDASRFTKAGITHYDMFMPDGSIPPRKILNQFLQLAETTNGPIAVHCKAGLGRTGSLIAAYLVKHYRMTAREAIAWMRICRPGSVIGHQQAWLENMESALWQAGQQYRLKYHGDGDMILHHKRGIYSIASKMERKIDLTLESEHHRLRQLERNVGHSRIEREELKANIPESLVYNTSILNKLNKSGLTNIIGRLCSINGNVPTNQNLQMTEMHRKFDMDATKCKPKVNNMHLVTQGDRLNEIKINRNKLSVNTLLLPKSNSPTLLPGSFKRMQRKKQVW